VLVGSALAYRGIPLQAAYCGAKHAIQGMFESVRSELLHRGSEVSIGTVHLPAMNTPQFEWCRNKMSQRPQPVPPIFQPEVAARAIEAMARSRRAEIDVAFSTTRAVVGNKIAPRVADWVLARRGYEAQQTSEQELPGRPDNLWTPVVGPFGAHGRFDERAHERSPQTWMTLHPGVRLASAGVVVLATALGSRALVRWIAGRRRSRAW
jgi:NAD(P)-dependent dehydrogenase (short-subunit alcohol dehydrogenase family)